MTIEEALVRHACETSFNQLPADVVAATKREILWTIGTSIAGASIEGSDAFRQFALAAGQSDEAGMLGYRDRASVAMAGFANGCFSKALEYEDKLWMDHFHGFAVATAVVSAATAVADYVGGIDGKTFLTAVALATDVQGRLAKTVPESVSSGWNASYIYAAFGACVAAARLLGLDRPSFHNAMGIAYAQTTGNKQNMIEGTLAQRAMMGFGVRNGITAALLARLRIDGAKHFLTGPSGMFPQFFKDREAVLDILTRDLGSAFQGTRLGFKAYPCGAVAHPILDALIARARQGLDPEDIRAVRIHGTTRLKIMAEPRDLRRTPKTQGEAIFSLYWAVACALIDHGVTLRHYTDAAIAQQRYHVLAEKTEIAMDLKDGIRVEIEMGDGRVVVAENQGAPLGHPDNPLSTEQVESTFRLCCGLGPLPIEAARIERALSMIQNIEAVPDVRDILLALTPAA